MKPITLILTRSDFDGNPHYSHHFDDLCEQLGLYPQDPYKTQIEAIEVTVSQAKVDFEEE